MKMRNTRSLAWPLVALVLLSCAAAALPLPEHDEASPSARKPEREEPLRVHFIDVGHGDACLIQCPGGENILIDAGSGFDYDGWSPRHTVDRYLKGRGVEKIDLLIATHPHSDHVGGIPAILGAYPVKMVLEPGRPHTTYSYRRFLEAVKASPDTHYKLGRAGQTYTFGQVRISILHPTGDLAEKINDCSIVCRLVYGNASFLFTGDAMKNAEKEILMRRCKLRSTVLKVGHHGSGSSTTNSFLKAVSPRVAVISCAQRKSLIYGDSEVLRRLKTGRASVYRTDEQGTIIVECTEKDCRVKVLGKEEEQG